MKTSKIKLITPFDIASGTITEVTLREPNAREALSIGEPLVASRTAEGGTLIVENNEAIAAYLDKIVVEPVAVSVLDRVGLADALQLKSAVIDFFTDARAAGLSAQPTSLSANASGSTPEASATQV